MLSHHLFHAGINLLRLFSNRLSANCYKPRLLLNQLERRCELTEVDILGPGGRSDEFLALHPAGKVPLLLLDCGTAVAESNAMLWYLARGTSFVPEQAVLECQVLQWMFFEQNQVEANIATARFWISVREKPELHAGVLPLWHEQGTRALEVMERHLKTREFFVGDEYSIADIALFGYTHLAHEGGFDLEPLPAVRAWHDRVRATPGYLPMSHG